MYDKWGMGVMADVHVEHEPFIPIKIDRTDYKVPIDPNLVNGAYLWKLGSVGSDYDKIHGNGLPRVFKALNFFDRARLRS